MPLRVVSRNHRANGKYVVEVEAKDIRLQAVVYASFSGQVEMPLLSVGDFCALWLIKDPATNAVRCVARKLGEPDPEPGLSRIISIFGTYNYADDMANWGPEPITFVQDEADIWFASDASVQPDWQLRPYPNWDPKAISHWIPTGYAGRGVFRVEVGQAVENVGGYVQANVAADRNGFAAREVKGYSPWLGNNKYVIDSGLQVPLLEPYIWCCGHNARVSILCAGYRLKL